MSERRALPSWPREAADPGPVVSRVVVIVPNWNGIGHLEACLRSLLAQEFADYAVILVDNGSRDGSLELVQREFPQVRVIANATNLGFATANNQAVRASRSEFVATLNNDAWADPRWLGELVRAMEARPEVGMCASRMLLADQPAVVDSAGIAVDRVGIAWGLGGGSPDGGSASSPIPVFSPCAGAALYRRAMLDEIGLFDEDFFMYYEDFDLCNRARQRGYKLLVVPQAQMWHRAGASTGERSPLQRYHLARSSVLFSAKHTRLPSGLISLVYRLSVIAVRHLGPAVRHGRRDVISAYFQGLVDGFRLLSGDYAVGG